MVQSSSPRPPALVVLSGGLDSTCALALALQEGPAAAVGFDYGQTHSRELRAAEAVGKHFDVDFQTIDLQGIMHGSALLGEMPVPRGGYDPDTMSDTVVQGRNLLFASVAIAAAPGQEVWLGVHSGDHHLYPDCRPEFWADLSRLAERAYGVKIRTPFLQDSKADALVRGAEAGAPHWLTWSCYVGGDDHCGECGTCLERREAYRVAGISDPTTYEVS